MNDYLVLIYEDGKVSAVIPTPDEDNAKMLAIIALWDKDNERAEVYARVEIEPHKVGYVRVGACLREEL